MNFPFHLDKNLTSKSNYVFWTLAIVILVLVITTDGTWQMNRWNFDFAVGVYLSAIYLFVYCQWAVLFISKNVTKGNKVNGNKQHCPSSPPASPMMSITLAHSSITAIQWLGFYLDVDSKVKMVGHWGAKSQESAPIS